MSNEIPTEQIADPDPIGETPGRFRGDMITISPHHFVIRSYTDTLHNGEIRVETGRLLVYDENEIVKKIRAPQSYKVDLNAPNKFGAGDEAVSFTETYRQ